MVSLLAHNPALSLKSVRWSCRGSTVPRVRPHLSTRNALDNRCVVTTRCSMRRTTEDRDITKLLWPADPELACHLRDHAPLALFSGHDLREGSLGRLPRALRSGYPEIKGCLALEPCDSIILGSPIPVLLITAFELRRSMLILHISAPFRRLGS